MPVTSELSEREREILHLVATGASNKEIARTLFISTNTVKVHLRNIFSKIGANTRTEAAMYAVSAGLIESGANEKVQVHDEISSDMSLYADSVLADLRKNKYLRWWALIGAIFVITLITAGVYVYRVRSNASQTSASPAELSAPKKWEGKKPLSIPRKGLAVVPYENQIYAIAGENSHGPTDIVEKYDPNIDTWQTLNPKPTAVSDVNAVVLGGKIYVPGGKAASGKPVGILEIYDPDKDTWIQGPPMPKPLSAYAVASFEGKFYLFGGWDGQEYVGTVYEYDPTQESWQEKTPMPTPRGYAGAAVSGGKVHVIGGYDGVRALSINEVYFPERDNGQDQAWSKAKSMPASRYAMGIATVADIIHIVGGMGQVKENQQTLVYFPNQDEWLASADTVSGEWSDLGLATIETRLYGIGGSVAGAVSGQNLSYQAIYTISLPLVR